MTETVRGSLLDCESGRLDCASAHSQTAPRSSLVEASVPGPFYTVTGTDLSSHPEHINNKHVL